MNDLVGKNLGQYLITELICHGGMATVYKGYQSSLDRDVAVKVLLRAHDAAFAARFEREARAIARLQHPYIMPIYDYGEQNGLLYLVLQYVDQGATLGDLVGTPMQPARALGLVRHVLGALDYAHQHGIIHRDIKPANILMRSPSWPLLGDFGIAKLANESGTLTQGGVLLGTAAYMAPEQALGRPADVRTDLYSTGVVLYELLTGQIPFQAADPVSVLYQHVHAPIPLPRSINPDLPPVVEQLLLRVLSKNPAARYQSAAEMAFELGSVAEQLERASDREQQRGLYELGARAFEAEQWDSAAEQLGLLVAREPGYQDAAELLQLARAAQRRSRSRGWRIGATAARGTAREYLHQGQQKEQAGDLAGALADYQAAHAAAPAGPAREELAALLAGVTARLRRERHQLPAGAAICPECGREVQLEWAGCPYCFAALQPPAAPAVPFERPERASSRTTALVSRPDDVQPGMAPWHDPKPQPGPWPGRSLKPPMPKLPALQLPALPIRRSPIWATLVIALLLSGGGGIIWANQRQPTSAAGTLANADTPIATPAPAPTQLRSSSAAVVASPSALPAAAATPLSPTAMPTAEPTAPPAAAPATPAAPLGIAAGVLNLRAGPGTGYPALGRYGDGTTFKLLGRNGLATWFKVSAPDGQVGWMSAQFLQLNVPAAELALADEPPLPTATRTPKPTARPQLPAPAPQQSTAVPAPAEAPTATAPPAEPTAPPEPTAAPEPRPTDKPKREPTQRPKEPPPPPKEPPPPPKG